MKIDRVKNLTIDSFVNDFVLPKKPVIVTDAMDLWKVERFTPEYLSRNYGDLNVQIYDTLFGLRKVDKLSRYFENNFDKKENPNQEYVRWYTKLKDLDFFWSDDFFLLIKENWGNPYFLPTSSYLVPNAINGEPLDITVDRFPYKGLFISGKGSKTDLHRDPFMSNAMLCQFYGEKQIKLYQPSQTPHLMNGYDFVDIENPDVERFPTFEHATLAFEDILCPKEIVYFPSGWFHDVTSLMDSISITWNFVHSSDAQMLSSYLSSHRDDDQMEVLRFFWKKNLNGSSDIQGVLDYLREIVDKVR